MRTAVRVSDQLIRDATVACTVDNRTLQEQIEHWAKIGQCAEENPDLPYQLIREIMLGIEELDRGESSEYQFG